MTNNKKKELILDAMQSIMAENKAQTASVQDIANRAGIGKSTIYYYFKSKDDILDAVLERNYSKAIEQSWKLVYTEDMPALTKLKQLFHICAYPHLELRQQEMVSYLHLQESALLHQKFLVMTIEKLTPILTDIIIQGIKEQSIQCHYPDETAEIILSIITFLLDPVIFPTEPEKRYKKLKALSELLEHSMHTLSGSFSFLYT